MYSRDSFVLKCMMYFACMLARRRFREAPLHTIVNNNEGSTWIFTKQQVEQMNEDDLRERVLIPLMRAMEYQDVFKYHGGENEKGKDIVCWYLGRLNNRINLTLVVKAKPLSGINKCPLYALSYTRRIALYR
jgi:hypothetical protein